MDSVVICGSGFGGQGGRFGRFGDPAGRGRRRETQGREGVAPVSWRYNALPFVEKGSQFKDIANDMPNNSEKQKDIVMGEKAMLDAGAKRMLELGPTNDNYDKDGNTVFPDMITNNIEYSNESDEVTGQNERNKCLKKVGAISTSNGSAGFQEEPVWEQ